MINRPGGAFLGTQDENVPLPRTTSRYDRAVMAELGAEKIDLDLTWEAMYAPPSEDADEFTAVARLLRSFGASTLSTRFTDEAEDEPSQRDDKRSHPQATSEMLQERPASLAPISLEPFEAPLAPGSDEQTPSPERPPSELPPQAPLTQRRGGRTEEDVPAQIRGVPTSPESIEQTQPAERSDERIDIARTVEAPTQHADADAPTQISNVTQSSQRDDERTDITRTAHQATRNASANARAQILQRDDEAPPLAPSARRSDERTDIAHTIEAPAHRADASTQISGATPSTQRDDEAAQAKAPQKSAFQLRPQTPSARRSDERTNIARTAHHSTQRADESTQISGGAQSTQRDDEVPQAKIAQKSVFELPPEAPLARRSDERTDVAPTQEVTDQSDDADAPAQISEVSQSLQRNDEAPQSRAAQIARRSDERTDIARSAHQSTQRADESTQISDITQSTQRDDEAPQAKAAQKSSLELPPEAPSARRSDERTGVARTQEVTDQGDDPDAPSQISDVAQSMQGKDEAPQSRAAQIARRSDELNDIADTIEASAHRADASTQISGATPSTQRDDEAAQAKAPQKSAFQLRPQAPSTRRSDERTDVSRTQEVTDQSDDADVPAQISDVAQSLQRNDERTDIARAIETPTQRVDDASAQNSDVTQSAQRDDEAPQGAAQKSGFELPLARRKDERADIARTIEAQRAHDASARISDVSQYVQRDDEARQPGAAQIARRSDERTDIAHATRAPSQAADADAPSQTSEVTQSAGRDDQPPREPAAMKRIPERPHAVVQPPKGLEQTPIVQHSDERTGIAHATHASSQAIGVDAPTQMFSDVTRSVHRDDETTHAQAAKKLISEQPRPVVQASSEHTQAQPSRRTDERRDTHVPSKATGVDAPTQISDVTESVQRDDESTHAQAAKKLISEQPRPVVQASSERRQGVLPSQHSDERTDITDATHTPGRAAGVDAPTQISEVTRSVHPDDETTHAQDAKKLISEQPRRVVQASSERIRGALPSQRSDERTDITDATHAPGRAADEDTPSRALEVTQSAQSGDVAPQVQSAKKLISEQPRPVAQTSSERIQGALPSQRSAERTDTHTRGRAADEDSPSQALEVTQSAGRDDESPQANSTKKPIPQWPEAIVQASSERSQRALSSQRSDERTDITDAPHAPSQAADAYPSSSQTLEVTRSAQKDDVAPKVQAAKKPIPERPHAVVQPPEGLERTPIAPRSDGRMEITHATHAADQGADADTSSQTAEVTQSARRDDEPWHLQAAPNRIVERSQPGVQPLEGPEQTPGAQRSDERTDIARSAHVSTQQSAQRDDEPSQAHAAKRPIPARPPAVQPPEGPEQTPIGQRSNARTYIARTAHLSTQPVKADEPEQISDAAQPVQRDDESPQAQTAKKPIPERLRPAVQLSPGQFQQAQPSQRSDEQTDIGRTMEARVRRATADVPAQTLGVTQSAQRGAELPPRVVPTSPEALGRAPLSRRSDERTDIGGARVAPIKHATTDTTAQILDVSQHARRGDATRTPIQRADADARPQMLDVRKPVQRQVSEPPQPVVPVNPVSPGTAPMPQTQNAMNAAASTAAVPAIGAQAVPLPSTTVPRLHEHPTVTAPSAAPDAVVPLPKLTPRIQATPATEVSEKQKIEVRIDRIEIAQPHAEQRKHVRKPTPSMTLDKYAERKR